MANSESEGFPSRKDVQEYLVLNDESFGEEVFKQRREKLN